MVTVIWLKAASAAGQECTCIPHPLYAWLLAGNVLGRDALGPGPVLTLTQPPHNLTYLIDVTVLHTNNVAGQLALQLLTATAAITAAAIAGCLAAQLPC